MKKLLLTACLLVAATTLCNAQWYVGGNVNFARGSAETTQVDVSNEAKNTRLGIAPRVGYIFDSRWSAGIGVGYRWGNTHMNGDKTATIQGITVMPYARFNCFFFGPFALAAEASAGYGNDLSRELGSPYKTLRRESFGVNITPVLDLDVSRRISLECRLNFFSLGYVHSKTTATNDGEKQVQKSNAIEAAFSGNDIFTLGDLSFGMIFKF